MIRRDDINENPDEGENKTGQRTGTISSDDNSYERRRQCENINPELGTSDQIVPSVQFGGSDGGGGSGTGSDGSGSRLGSNTYDEPVAGPSGINCGASTSRVYFPSPFEDDEEGKRPKKKMCGSQIDYGDYDFDDEDYSRLAFDYKDYDLDDPNNNTDNDANSTDINFIARQMFIGPLFHHGYTKTFHYFTGEPRGDISAADWIEAGPSGINMVPGTSSADLFPVPGPSEPNDHDTSVNSEQGATGGGTLPSDSDLSSSCSHRSLVDRYTHMNISGCEDQTDEECNFDETDVSDEESQL